MDVATKFAMFLRAIEGACLQAFPEKSYPVRSDQSNNISWFGDDLKRMRETLNFLYDLHRQYNTEITLNSYKYHKKYIEKL